MGQEDLLYKTVKKCQQNDRQAQKELYDRYSNEFFRMTLRYAATKEDAEDILLQSFQKIFRDIVKYRQEGSFEGWMKKIVIRTALTHLRNYKNRLQLIHLDIPVAEQYQEFQAENYNQISSEEIYQMIRSLPEGYRIVFNLYVIDGYSHIEISEQLGVSVATSRSQYHRARKALQSMIAHQVKNKQHA